MATLEVDVHGSRWVVAVIGPGGVGGLVGGLLVRAGHRVVFVARPDTAAALRSRGVTVRSAQHGEFSVRAEAVSTLAEPVDACLVTTKATTLEAAVSSVPPDVVGDALIVPLLNGVEHMALLRERFPVERVVAGAIRVESTRMSPGIIAHTSPFAFVELASHTAPRERVDELAGQLGQAGLDVTVREDEATMLWDKLAFLAPLALLTTHHGAPAGVIRDDRRSDLLAAIREAVAVARAEGAPVDETVIEALFERVPADLKSSMQRDAEAGRPTELDAIGGAVLRAAQRHDISVPVTARLVAELHGRKLRD